MAMLKTIFTFLVFIITLAIFCSNTVESRMIHRNFQGLSPSQLHLVHLGNDPINGDSSNEDDGDGYMHTKRKSELLASLYGLPYNLVGKRKAT